MIRGMARILGGIKEKFLSLLRKNESLLSQFVLTYGTMTSILVLLGIIHKYTNEGGAESSKLWSLIVNAYSPTTITFVASLIFEHARIKNSKIKTAVFLFLVIFMALTYMAFEAIYAQSLGDGVIATLGMIGIVIPIVSLIVLFVSIRKIPAQPDNIKNQTADGSISAIRSM